MTGPTSITLEAISTNFFLSGFEDNLDAQLRLFNLYFFISSANDSAVNTLENLL